MPPRSEPAPRPAGRLAGALVVLGLASIAAVLVVRQWRRPPWREPLVAEVAPASLDLAPFAAPWVALGPLERYGPGTLHEKIDGQADLYLKHGFHKLSCQRFGAPAQPGAALELRLYTLESAVAARSVRALQARPEEAPLGEGLAGGCAAGACFIAAGTSYLEVLPMGGAGDRAREVALAFAAARGGSEPPIFALFPEEGLVAGSVVEEVQDAFGIEALDGVAIATYRGTVGPMLAWIARGRDGSALREAVRAELEHLGGTARIEDDLVVVEILGSTCVLAAGPGGAAGVQEAADPADALALGRRLATSLEGAAP